MLRPPLHSGHRAFTLIELLTALGIIAALASMLFVATRTLRRKAQGVTCASNLRNIGLAVLSYAHDHDGVLPGPLNLGQTIYYKKDDGALAGYLWPYLSLAEYKAGVSLRAAIMACPAWLASLQDDTGSCYQVNQEAYRENNARVPPFGNRSEGKPPLRLAKLENPAGTVALYEMDQMNASLSFQGNPKVPKEPVHFSYRNTLYLDGHVEAIPITVTAN